MEILGSDGRRREIIFSFFIFFKIQVVSKNAWLT
jgi:hypothetical protein